MVRDRGFEPLTPSVSRKCSTTELTAQALKMAPQNLLAIRVGGNCFHAATEQPICGRSKLMVKKVGLLSCIPPGSTTNPRGIARGQAHAGRQFARRTVRGLRTI